VNNNYNSNTVVKQDFAVVKQVDGRAAHMIDTLSTRAGSSASTTAPSKILLLSPKFLFSQKISLPPKRQKKSRKFRQFEPNVS
jgi:hypothetical protein